MEDYQGIEMNKKHLSILLVFSVVISLITINQLIVPQEKENWTWVEPPIRFGLQAQDISLPATLNITITRDVDNNPLIVYFSVTNLLHQTWFALDLYNTTGANTWIEQDRVRSNLQGNMIGFQDPVPAAYFDLFQVLGNAWVHWRNISYVPCCDSGTVVFGQISIVTNQSEANFGTWGIQMRYD